MDSLGQFSLPLFAAIVSIASLVLSYRKNAVEIAEGTATVFRLRIDVLEKQVKNLEAQLQERDRLLGDCVEERDRLHDENYRLARRLFPNGGS